jgi:phosphate-selective porin
MNSTFCTRIVNHEGCVFDAVRPNNGETGASTIFIFYMSMKVDELPKYLGFYINNNLSA